MKTISERIILMIIMFDYYTEYFWDDDSYDYNTFPIKISNSQKKHKSLDYREKVSNMVAVAKEFWFPWFIWNVFAISQ